MNLKPVELLFTCPNDHQLTFIKIGKSPEPPFCMTCLLLWTNRSEVTRD